MSTESRRHRRLLVGITLAVALAFGALPGTPARAAEDFTLPWPKLPGESDWPADHLVGSDPLPGDADYIAPYGTAVPPPDGMADADFLASDPAGYAAVLPERDTIEVGLLANVHLLLASAGITRDKNVAMSESDATRVTTLLAATPYSPYGYLKFTLVPSTSPYARNGYLGTLYFIYGVYQPVTDSYRWFKVSWPARSGNNRPASQRVSGLGPIPEYTWDFGFMGGSWRGYEPDGRAEFYPGKWRLDPWTGGPYGRSYLEVHGGSGTHLFAATKGCIRVYPAALQTLKSYYDTKMVNKKNRSNAHLYVDY